MTLLVVWTLGFVAPYATSGFIHVLLALAVVAVLVGVIQDRKALR